jgi:hypothetical protein
LVTTDLRLIAIVDMAGIIVDTLAISVAPMFTVLAVH